jgi:hypothetical protein
MCEATADLLVMMMVIMVLKLQLWHDGGVAQQIRIDLNLWLGLALGFHCLGCCCA